MNPLTVRIRYALTALAAVGLLYTAPSFAAPPVFEIEIRNHLFDPSTINIPAHTKIRLIVYNRDSTPEEFESFELNREKIIVGGSKASVFIGPLKPGVYPFFGEFNPKTALGKIIVAEKSDAAQ